MFSVVICICSDFLVLELKCILHTGKENSKENIIPFTDESLQTCHLKKQIRDSRKKRKSKFDDIYLPEKTNSSSGYHPSCYRYFTAVTDICSVSLKKPDSGDSTY